MVNESDLQQLKKQIGLALQKNSSIDEFVQNCVPLVMEYAEKLLVAEQYAEAANAFEMVYERDNTNTRAFEGHGRAKKIGELLKKGIAAQQAYFKNLEYDYSHGQEAEESFKELLKLNPNDKIAKKSLEDLESYLKKTPKAQVKKLIYTCKYQEAFDMIDKSTDSEIKKMKSLVENAQKISGLHMKGSNEKDPFVKIAIYQEILTIDPKEFMAPIYITLAQTSVLKPILEPKIKKLVDDIFGSMQPDETRYYKKVSQEQQKKELYDGLCTYLTGSYMAINKQLNLLFEYRNNEKVVNTILQKVKVKIKSCFEVTGFISKKYYLDHSRMRIGDFVETAVKETMEPFKTTSLSQNPQSTWKKPPSSPSNAASSSMEAYTSYQT